MRQTFSVAVMAVLLGLGCQAASPSTWQSPTLDQVRADLEGLAFDAFIETSFRDYVLRFPEWVTRMGMAQEFGVRDDRLNDYSGAYALETTAIEDEILKRLSQFDRALLSPSQQRTYDACLWYWDDLVRGHPYVDCDYPVSHFFVTSLDQQIQELLFEIHPLHTAANAEDYVARLEAIPVAFDGILEGLDRRAAAGSIVPRPIIDLALPGLRQIADARPGSSTFYVHLRDRLASIADLDGAGAEQLLVRAEAAVSEGVLPAYDRLATKLSSLRSIAPTDIGVGRSPEGVAYYAYLVRHYAGVDLSPGEIHEIGLSEVDRIQAEIREVAADLGYPKTASMLEVFGRATRDGGTLLGDAVLDEYTRLIEDAKAKSSDFLSCLPSTEVEVRSDPVGGFYRTAPRDGSQPGVFGAQTSLPQAKYAMPTLAYHETVPGHHVQIALAQEMHLPLMLSETTFLGYTEGWAMYAERLAWEAGWYDGDPYGNLGRLQNELMRAARLVVDTGIHALSWGYTKALSYYRTATGRAPGYAEFDINRYAVWPGQAVSYYVGYLELMELRDQARLALGDGFDLMAFHDALLAGGNVPLELVAAAVALYIDAGSP